MLRSDCPCGRDHEILTFRQANQRYGEIWVGDKGEVWVCHAND